MTKISASGTKVKGKFPAPRRGNGWQAEKSAAMQVQILEGAVRCLVKIGYVRTSTTEIATEAGVSRGAMSHHFKSKDDLIKATVEYLNVKRIENFRVSIAALKPSSDKAHDRLDIYWAHLTDPLFAAFEELLFAARTNPELAAVMIPAANQFEVEWGRMVREMMPDWAEVGPLFDLANDLTQFIMEGMAMHMLVDPNPERYAKIRRYLADRLAEMQSVAAKQGNTALHKFIGRSD